MFQDTCASLKQYDSCAYTFVVLSQGKWKDISRWLQIALYMELHHSQIRCDIWIYDRPILGVLYIAWPQTYPKSKLSIARKTLVVSYNTSKIFRMIRLVTHKHKDL